MNILREESFVDKNNWLRGEWENEPDLLEWRYKDFPCLIVRGPSGALCGYVGVPKDHPCYEKDYNNVDVDVHCGLTYADHCQEGGKICHTPLSNESDKVWWLGFDCAHLGDFTPAYEKFNSNIDYYKNLDFVINEVKSLADQLLDRYIMLHLKNKDKK